MEASTQISKQGLGGKTICGRFQIPAGISGQCMKAIHEAEKVKPKLQWRPQECGLSGEESHKQQVEPAQELQMVRA
jgi:hypothetical protein